MKIGTIKGIEIRLHYSTLVIIGLVGFYAGSYYLDMISGTFNIFILVLVGVASGLLMLFSILSHELMHSLMAKKYGLGVSEIEFHMFGGVSKIEEEPKTPKAEFWISLVGPLTSLILGAILIGLLVFSSEIFGTAFPIFIYVILLYSGISNIGLGFFNLLPAFPMDGGRILRAYLWKKKQNLLKATKTASKIGRGIAYVLIGLGFIEIFLLGLFGGLWLIVIGWFLSSTSKRAYAQTVVEVKLSKLLAGEIFTDLEPSIPKDTPISEAIRNYFLKYKKSYFPVIDNEKIIGIINIERIKDTPFDRRPQITIKDYFKKISEFPTIKKDEPVKNAYKEISNLEQKPEIVIVKDDTGRPIGLIGKSEIRNSLKISKLFFEDT
jgi:Zn-dependent protease/predicted transcriptional regulator